MAHFAELDQNSVVLQVIVIDNDDITDADGNESEDLGVSRCKEIFGQHTNWKQTSYNANFRKNYAYHGCVYNNIIDAFIPPKPWNSWILDIELGRWVAPDPYPDDGKEYNWDEKNRKWRSSEITE